MQALVDSSSFWGKGLVGRLTVFTLQCFILGYKSDFYFIIIIFKSPKNVVTMTKSNLMLDVHEMEAALVWGASTWLRDQKTIPPSLPFTIGGGK